MDFMCEFSKCQIFLPCRSSITTFSDHFCTCPGRKRKPRVDTSISNASNRNRLQICQRPQQTYHWTQVNKRHLFKAIRHSFQIIVHYNSTVFILCLFPHHYQVLMHYHPYKLFNQNRIRANLLKLYLKMVLLAAF